MSDDEVRMPEPRWLQSAAIISLRKRAEVAVQWIEIRLPRVAVWNPGGPKEYRPGAAVEAVKLEMAVLLTMAGKLLARRAMGRAVPAGALTTGQRKVSAPTERWPKKEKWKGRPANDWVNVTPVNQ